MLKLLQTRVVLVLCAGAIAALGGGCSLISDLSGNQSNTDTPSISIDQASSQPIEQGSASADPSISPQPNESASPTPEAVDTAQQTTATLPDPYPDAINRASAAFNLSQSAQSHDDWLLVSNRWQQAIDLMATVPSSSPNHGNAQQKLTEYRRNLTFARQQAALPVPNASDGNVISIQIESPSSSSNNRSQSTPQIAGIPSGGGVFRAPIVRRAGGTPVVMVTFNGNQTFEMIVDTGASGTVITQPVARALNVNPVGSTNVATASERNATFLLGYVNSLEVGGARTQNLLVAIAGPELGTGLLGHDFFGDFDVTVRQNVVEFRER
ncbi:MAG: retropepsin-like aspartic protease [Cyanobacteria bacterium P01_A01_bin.37]